jgi:serine/threonine-protein kinase RsbW
MNLNDMVKLDLPADPKYLSILSAVIDNYLEHISGINEREMTVYNMKLAAQECCTNIIDHSYVNGPNGRIKACLTLEDEPRRVLIEFHDTGKSVEPTTVAEPQLKVGSERGYGLFLMNELMDEVSYSRDDKGNYWRLVKLL